jgi:uncharacterized protein (DUF427 family)
VSPPGLPWRSRPDPEPAEGIAPNGLPRESVWDYPRPPAIRPEPREVVVTLGGAPVARSNRAVKVCETAGPPAIYLPPEDIADGVLTPVRRGTYCEWKGSASYYDVAAGGEVAKRAAWTYREPKDAFSEIRGYVSFYPALVDCTLAGEKVEPQPGRFYGGWVTAEITGPFKGGPGSLGW